MIVSVFVSVYQLMELESEMEMKLDGGHFYA